MIFFGIPLCSQFVKCFVGNDFSTYFFGRHRVRLNLVTFIIPSSPTSSTPLDFRCSLSNRETMDVVDLLSLLGLCLPSGMGIIVSSVPWVLL